MITTCIVSFFATVFTQPPVDATPPQVALEQPADGMSTAATTQTTPATTGEVTAPTSVPASNEVAARPSVRPIRVAPAQAGRAPGKTSKRRKWGDITPRWRLDGLLDYRTVYHFKKPRDEGYRERDGGVGVAVRFDHHLGHSKFFLGGQIGVQWRQGIEVDSRAFYAHADTTRIPLHLRGVFRPIDGIDLYAHAGPSLNFTMFRDQWLQVGVEHVRLERRQVGLGGEAVLGMSIYVPRAWLSRRQPSHATFGVDLNGGAAFGPNIPVVFKGNKEAVNPIERRDLGRLKTGGYTFNIGIFVRFM